MRRRVVCPRSHPASLYARALSEPFAAGSRYWPGGRPPQPPPGAASLYARALSEPFAAGSRYWPRGETPAAPTGRRLALRSGSFRALRRGLAVLAPGGWLRANPSLPIPAQETLHIHGDGCIPVSTARCTNGDRSTPMATEQVKCCHSIYLLCSPTGRYWARAVAMTPQDGRHCRSGQRPWSPHVLAGQVRALLGGLTAGISDQERARSRSYSVLLNSAIATPIKPRPMSATMPSDSHSGTGHPTQVMAGDRCVLMTASM
jgi:hypothetical protein